jgi:hypothetical protein
MRIATFNLENLDDEPGQDPSLASRAAILRPQLERLAADILAARSPAHPTSELHRASSTTRLGGTRRTEANHGRASE